MQVSPTPPQAQPPKPALNSAAVELETSRLPEETFITQGEQDPLFSSKTTVSSPQAARDMRTSELEMKVQVPAGWSDGHIGVVGIEARDSGGRGQFTRWTEGQCTAENINYDTPSHTLTLHYRPSITDVNEQGHTDDGFDPSAVQSWKVFTSSEAGKPAPVTDVNVVETNIIPEPAQAPAEVRPLLKPNGASSGHPSIQPNQQIAGVARYFQYDDLQHWPDVKDNANKILAAQDANDLHAFRLMGGLDLRNQYQQSQLDPAIFPAMAGFLDECRANHQDNVIVALLDGAIPNPTLWKAFQDDGSRKQLVETLRPFIKEFGNAQVNGKPVVYDLVNEIHGAPSTEGQKQQLVHDLVDTFVQEAPGAHLTIGVQNFRELRYWTHLFDDYKDKPVHFDMTFHLWEDINNVPKAGELNIPDNVTIGITEADPTKDLKGIAQQSAQKGYDEMLFWTDGSIPYSPEAHHQAIQ